MCSIINLFWYFNGVCCLHLQGDSIWFIQFYLSVKFPHLKFFSL
jgi:hypothetical protein